MHDHPILANLAASGIRLGLPRMEAFLAWCGNPHLRYPVLHVAGTNGKGSTCRMIAAILEAHGLRVGVTTSPHLQHVNERLRVDGRPIDDMALDARIVATNARVRAWAAEALPDEPTPLTWFEFSIAMAFLHFAEENVDVAVVEVGMGGRLDATNVVAPCVTAITSIGLDHTDQLGPDLASIAGEKAGIVKEGVPVVVGRLPHEALAVIRAIAGARNAPLSILGTDFDAAGTAGGFTWSGSSCTREGLALALEGDHQVGNAAVAIRAVELLPAPLRPTEQAIRVGLRQARNAGRLERVDAHLLLDGAHNVEGAGVLAAWLAAAPRTGPRTLLLGTGSDKDPRGLAVVLAPHVDEVLVTRCAHPKARSGDDLLDELATANVTARDAGPIEIALPALHARARANDGLLIVAGSLYLVGAARDVLGLDGRA